MDGTLVEWLAESCRRYPSSEAVIQADRRLTYQQLWNEVLRVAHYLRESGLQKEDRVALLLDNSPEYIAAYYGVLAAGGAVVALNTAVKAPEISNWLRHSGAKYLFADASHPELKSVSEECGSELQVILVSAGGEDGHIYSNSVVWDALPVSVDNALPETVSHSDDDLAAIIYTSGTTGDPKGVMLCHGNLRSNMASILDYLKLSEKDSIVNVLPFYYSYGNSVLHTHLAVGGCLVLENSLMYPHQVVQKMVDERVSGFSGVPSTFALLLSRVQLSDYDLSSLRYLTQAGGPMSPAHIKRLKSLLPESDLIIMYGQTEASARLTYLPAEKLEQKLGSAGIPIPGVNIEIRDEHGQPVPRNTVGEIYATGKNLMKGYWKNPQATKKVLVDGWLKTGDIALMDDDGYIFIQGRNSDMIKAGANRISPKEIEEAILELDEVAEVVVVGIADEILGEAIKAVIVKRKDAELDRRRVLSHCRSRLATYKIPKHVEFSESLPKTASGKIKRYMLVNSDN